MAVGRNQGGSTGGGTGKPKPSSLRGGKSGSEFQVGGLTGRRGGAGKPADQQDFSGRGKAGRNKGRPQHGK